MLTLAAAIALSGALIWMVTQLTGNVDAQVGGAAAFGQRSYLTAASSGGALVQPGPIEATSTVHYLTTATASSTVRGKASRGTDIIVDATGIASSSATVYSCSMQYGRDFGTSNYEWFDEDLVTNTSNIAQTHSSSTPKHTWAPQVTTRWTKHLVFEDVEAELYKLTCGVTGANGSIWAEVSPLEPTPR